MVHATSLPATASSSTAPLINQQSSNLHAYTTTTNSGLPPMMSPPIPSTLRDTLNPYAAPYISHVYQHPNSLFEGKHIHNQMIQTQELLSAMSLPQPEVPKFDGDPIEYITFTMAFDARITSRINNNCDRLYYLDQHLQGET